MCEGGVRGSRAWWAREGRETPCIGSMNRGEAQAKGSTGEWNTIVELACVIVLLGMRAVARGDGFTAVGEVWGTHSNSFHISYVPHS